MSAIEKLLERIVLSVNINLREMDFDVAPLVKNLLPFEQLTKFYAFYGITPQHSLNFEFTRSNLAGSYFLGRCAVDHAILYKTDIRGDELKSRGDLFPYENLVLPVYADEIIRIRNAFLIKTLVHNFSHDPEKLEEFNIENTLAMHYSNIHGSPTEGSYLGPFCTVDLTAVHDSVLRRYSYVQAGEIFHMSIDPGTIWVRSGGDFNFLYRFDQDILARYIRFEAGKEPEGIFLDFVESRQADFERVFETLQLSTPAGVPETSSLDRYAVIRPSTRIGENVLVAQRAYLENATLGKGSNAQENCYIVNSHLEGLDVTAHGGKVIHARLGRKVFVGFNSFLQGSAACPLTIGAECIVMPHTIIDLKAPVSIPAGHLVWGYIEKPEDLAQNSVPLEEFARVKTGFIRGNLLFEGDGGKFVDGFRHRIEHILEANGAYFDGTRARGHAQKNQNISFNTLQPYPYGEMAGLYPTILIKP
jgi:carbonic anhydrase/acetyltransferase-like protein (isoleucine patch superfamily)